MNLRFMLRLRLLTAVLFFLCITLLWFAQLGSCAAFLEMSLGYAPMQASPFSGRALSLCTAPAWGGDDPGGWCMRPCPCRQAGPQLRSFLNCS